MTQSGKHKISILTLFKFNKGKNIYIKLQNKDENLYNTMHAKYFS